MYVLLSVVYYEVVVNNTAAIRTYVCCKSIAHGHWAPIPYSLRDTGPETQLRVTPRLWL